MKFRTDFVSNSSSCSFIIHLQSKKDLSEFQKIAKNIQKSYLIDYYYGTVSDIYKMEILNLDRDKLEQGDWVQVYCGEDSLENIERFDDVQWVFQESDYKFKFYADNDAHYTFGENLPGDK